MSVLISREMISLLRECLDGGPLDEGEFRRVTRLGDLFVSFSKPDLVPLQYRYMSSLRIDGIQYWLYSLRAAATE